MTLPNLKMTQLWSCHRKLFPKWKRFLQLRVARELDCHLTSSHRFITVRDHKAVRQTDALTILLLEAAVQAMNIYFTLESCQ